MHFVFASLFWKPLHAKRSTNLWNQSKVSETFCSCCLLWTLLKASVWKLSPHGHALNAHFKQIHCERSDEWMHAKRGKNVTHKFQKRLKTLTWLENPSDNWGSEGWWNTGLDEDSHQKWDRHSRDDPWQTSWGDWLSCRGERSAFRFCLVRFRPNSYQIIGKRSQINKAQKTKR